MVIEKTIKIDDSTTNRIIEKQLHEFKEFLLYKKAQNKLSYSQWQEDFNLIYNKEILNHELFLNHAVLYYIGLGFFFKFLYNKKDNQENFLEEVKRKGLYLDYFSPFSKSFTLKDFNDLKLLVFSIIEQILNIVGDPEYLFDYIVHKIISPIIRHNSGEFYTPPFLVKKMVKETYRFGSKVLDPCCGSGNFLIEILKSITSSKKSETEKLSAINKVHGCDINPISIFLTRINVLYVLRHFPLNFNLHLRTCDFLFQNMKFKEDKFDLIIGNPPWYTLRDIDSIEYQEKIKDLSGELEIKPLPKNILNIEISTLFFFLSKTKYMKNNSQIFFLITKGVITGSHASRFRSFKGFKNIVIWTFDKKVEIVFNIDFICLYAQKSDQDMDYSIKEIPTYCFTIDNSTSTLNYFVETEMKQKWIKSLIPYSIEKKGSKTFVKKLILKEFKKDLLPTGESYYKDLFHKGADLNPRNLIFTECVEVNDSFFKLNPDMKIFKRAKEPWTKLEYKDQVVEKQYVFDVIKSTELIKFYVYDFYKVFLPLSKSTLSFNYENLEINAKAFYDKINEIYLEKKKETTQHDSLMDNLNRWGKLINKRQLSKIKVVYNNSGSILNSAVIQGDFLITGDLSFFETENLDEAYYLVAILNSPIMTDQIKIKKSSRHIFKIPLEIPIEKFNPINHNHRKLVELAKQCQKIVKSIIKDKIQTKESISKYRIQNILKEKLKKEMVEIDKVLKLEFS